MKIPNGTLSLEVLKAEEKAGEVQLESGQLKIEGSPIHRGRAAQWRSAMRLREGPLMIKIYYVEDSFDLLDVGRDLNVVIRFQPFFACPRTCTWESAGSCASSLWSQTLPKTNKVFARYSGDILHGNIQE